MEGQSLFEVAEEYLAKGYSIIPIEAGGKKPLIKWQEYQTRKASLDEALDWFPKEVPLRDQCNIGVVTGVISGLTVVDVDYRHGGMDTAKALGLPGGTVVTGGGGFHRYYKYCPLLPRNNAGQLPGLDIRSEGGYVLAPPSRTLGVYSFTTSEIPDNRDLPPIPEALAVSLSSLRKRTEPSDFIKVSGKAGTIGRRPIEFIQSRTGSRNNDCAIMAGRILRCYEPTYDNGLNVLVLWNSSHCNPPLVYDELKLTYNSIWNKHHKSKGTT